MTEKLYEQNSMLKSCCSSVVACSESDGKYLVELDKTVFFPEGGGQLSDRGKLDDVAVTYVFEKNSHIYHVCDKEFNVGQQVTAQLDWEVRLDRMQQHLGEHLLSYAVWKLYQANNVGFHMNENMVTIDLDKELTQEELLQAEKLTNSIIWENRPVHISYVDSTEAAAMPMRKINHNLTGMLRIVAVEDADICTCCGTHPPFTGMIGCVKVIRSEKHKQGVRVEFACGQRAIADYQAKNKVLLQAAADLSAKPLEVYDKIQKLKEEMAVLHENIKGYKVKTLSEKLDAALQQAMTDKQGNRFIMTTVPESGDFKLLLPLAAKYDKCFTVLVAVQTERISYAVVAGSGVHGSCRDYIKVLNEVFAGRGGGKDDCAQGGSACCSDWQERLACVNERIKG